MKLCVAFEYLWINYMVVVVLINKKQSLWELSKEHWVKTKALIRWSEHWLPEIMMHDEWHVLVGVNSVVLVFIIIYFVAA